MKFRTGRAQRLIEEFQEASNTPDGLANVLLHLASAWNAGPGRCVRCSTLEELAAELASPSLLESALAGNRAAALRYLHEAGIVDLRGQLTKPYQLEDLNDD